MEAENVDEEKISGRAAAESVDEEFGRVASTRNEDPLPKLDEIKTTETQTDEADGQSKDKLALAIAQLQASISEKICQSLSWQFWRLDYNDIVFHSILRTRYTLILDVSRFKQLWVCVVVCQFGTTSQAFGGARGQGKGIEEQD
ncbi:predicted protein [Arabidopsis lyrata subsp. lyrata]|uniref:Predicted protein n=1 Tax=Arabidopsis lyrata subsp. lyrata TaxID=81972 RepID=D7KYC1_ARALL|nr:predicted protein [Arabidopsis lyrata subsp. lyrata]